jgi:hypothetical protein
MAFILGVNDDNTQIVNAVNYLLTNLGQQNTLIVDAITGQIISPFTGQVVSYLYEFINIRYATSSDGLQNFSQSPTNATYYGVRNSDISAGTEVPSDYVWTLASPPFGTTNYLWYSTIGGRQIVFVESPTAPNSLFQQVQNNVPINLDVTTNSSNTTQINCYARIAGNPTPAPGTIVTTAQTLPTQLQSFSTWNLNTAWSLVDPNPSSPDSLYISNGQYNIATNETTWNTPYVGQFNVTALSQISTNLGTVVTGNVIGNILVNTTANITGNVFFGNGSQLTNLPIQPGTYSNANVAAYLPTNTSDVAASFFIGDGSLLTNLPIQPGTYSNANVAAYLPTNTSDVAASFFIGDGSLLTNLPIQPGTYSNANVAAYLPTYGGDIDVANVTSGLWKISVTAGANLLFQYGGTNVASLSSTGSLVLAGTLTQSGTPT